MSLLYVTTSRNASDASRQLAEWLEILLGAISENRGRRSLDEVVWRAKMHGRTRIVFVADRGGHAGELAFYDAQKGWLPTLVRLDSVELTEPSGRAYRKPVRMSGRNAAVFRDLFAFEPVEEEHTDFIELRADAAKLTFWHSQLQIGPTLTYRLEELRGAPPEEAATE